jgi:hypothetical protein
MNSTGNVADSGTESDVISVHPFGVNFEEACLEEPNRFAETNTRSMDDDDTNTYRKDTDDYDT